MKKKNIIITFSILLGLIFILVLFVISKKSENNNVKELISYGVPYYHIDDEDVYVYFFQDNTCILNITTESCKFDVIDNDKIFLKMTAKENGNSAIAEMSFNIINKSKIERTSFKIGTDYDNMTDTGGEGIFTINKSEIKDSELLKNELWHKQFNLAGSKDNPYATLKLLKGNKCEIDFSYSSKSVKLDTHQFININYKNGICTYNKTNDLDFVIKYTGTFDITHPISQLSSSGIYVFQTENQELKITFKDSSYNSFNITNGEWDIENHAIYLKEKGSNNSAFKTENNNVQDDNNDYIIYAIESNETIKSISDKFEMDYKDILDFNNLEYDNLSENIESIKIPTNKMFSKIDSEIYNNIKKIELYFQKNGDSYGERYLKIYMKDGNQVIVYFNYLSKFNNYLEYKSAIEKDTTGNWKLYLDNNMYIELLNN